MKELSIEEKAKAYDEAIEIARAKYAMKDQPTHQDLVDIFPELAESKNEKMIQYFKDLAPFDKAEELYEKYGFSHKDALAWLEKRVGQKPIEWSDEDIATISRVISIVKWAAYSDHSHPILNDKGATELVERLKSLRPQMQWKAVDKEIYVKEPALAQRKDKSEPNHGYVICYDHTLTPDVYERFIMISDIYNQSHWKPSDEQMEALKSSTYCQNEQMSKVLFELYQDLKKLKE